jgi:hypothetical protein
MLLLVSGATTTVEKYIHKNLGQLLTPQTNNSIERILRNNLPWACDNGCFNGLDDTAFLKRSTASQTCYLLQCRMS